MTPAWQHGRLGDASVAPAEGEVTRFVARLTGAIVEGLIAEAAARNPRLRASLLLGRPLPLTLLRGALLLLRPLLAATQRLVREGVVADAELADAGVIFGTGFAPYTGGPMNYLTTGEH